MLTKPAEVVETICPYCRNPLPGQSQYWWRIVSISDGVPIPRISESVKAMEIYCATCNHTISLTPLPKTKE